jgi:hypothetical protein
MERSKLDDLELAADLELDEADDSQTDEESSEVTELLALAEAEEVEAFQKLLLDVAASARVLELLSRALRGAESLRAPRPTARTARTAAEGREMLAQLEETLGAARNALSTLAVVQPKLTVAVEDTLDLIRALDHEASALHVAHLREDAAHWSAAFAGLRMRQTPEMPS